ncbi:phosphodiester glycosidase family protein [Paenibacillus sp. CAU 1782]
MMNPVKLLNRTALFAITPLLGIIIWLLSSNIAITLSSGDIVMPEMRQSSQSSTSLEQLATGLDQAQETAAYTGESLRKQVELYDKTNAEMTEISKLAAAQAGRPLAIYDAKITARLGKASQTISSDKLRAQLFYLQNEQFRSYAVKIQLKSPDAMDMVLGGSELGQSMTTLEAVKKHGAAVGVNAGGFADSKGSRYPLSTTMVNGEYVTGFQPTYLDLFFVGLSESGKLVGGKFDTQEQLDAKKPKFGATFVPVLLKGGSKQEIPAKWQNSPKRAPRTVIANYKDNQILLLVTDGYNEAGSSGASLTELQNLLQSYGVIDAYNLDGGGSSSLVFNGKLINKPSDGSLRKLPTHFLFYK